MAVTQTGIGVVWGVGNITLTGFHATEPTGKNQSVNGERTANVHDILDGNGEKVGRIFFDGMKKVTINVVPSAATKALALTNMEKYLPAPGTPITLSDSDVTSGTFEQVYSLINVKCNRSNDKEVTIDMELEMSTVNDITTVISS